LHDAHALPVARRRGAAAPLFRAAAVIE